MARNFDSERAGRRRQARDDSHVDPRALAVWLLAAGLLFVPPSGPAAQGAAVAVGVTLSNTAIAPGEALTIGVRVTNPGGGPPADIIFAILLPDGATVVSAGPGVGARFGRFDNLRSLVPVVGGLSLAGAFEYRNESFFSHTFLGSEPLGTYRVYFAVLRSGALNDGVIGGGELLALETAEFVVSPGPIGQVDPSRQVAGTVTRSAGGTVTTTAGDGTVLSLVVPPAAVRQSTPIAIAPLTGVQNLAEGTFLAGLNGGPAGLRFDVPATLTLTFPEPIEALPFRLVGLVIDNDGRNAEVVPVLVEGNVVRLSVRHFSNLVVLASKETLRV